VFIFEQKVLVERLSDHLAKKTEVTFSLHCVYLERYRAFHRYGQAKFPDGGSVLGSSQFSVLPQLPPKQSSVKEEVKMN